MHMQVYISQYCMAEHEYSVYPGIVTFDVDFSDHPLGTHSCPACHVAKLLN